MTRDQKHLPALVEPKQTPLKIQDSPAKASLLESFPIGSILESYAQRKVWDSKTQAQEARNHYARAREEGAVALRDWRLAEASLENLPQLVETVKNTVTADLLESKLRVTQANAELEIFDLELEARKARAKAGIATANLEQKQAEDALKPVKKEEPRPSVEDEMEALNEKIHKVQADFKKRQEEEGGDLSEAEHEYFVKREAMIIQKLQRLQEQSRG